MISEPSPHVWKSGFVHPVVGGIPFYVHMKYKAQNKTQNPLMPEKPLLHQT